MMQPAAANSLNLRVILLFAEAHEKRYRADTSIDKHKQATTAPGSPAWLCMPYTSPIAHANTAAPAKMR